MPQTRLHRHVWKWMPSGRGRKYRPKSTWGFSSVVRQTPEDLITLIISRQMWLAWHSGKWPLARNADRIWWHHHVSKRLFGRSLWLQERQKNVSQKITWVEYIRGSLREKGLEELDWKDRDKGERR